MAVIGIWLIAASVVWFVAVVAVVAYGLGFTHELRRNGCGLVGGRSDAGLHGSGTQPRPAEPARGITKE